MALEQGLREIAAYINAIIEDSYDVVDSYTNPQLEKFIITINASVKELQNSQATLEGYKATLQSNLNSVLNSNAEVEKELAETKEQNTKLQARYDELLTNNAILSSENAELKQKQTELENKANDPEKDMKMSEAYSKIRTLKEELNAERSKPDYSDEVVRLRNEVEGYKARIEQFESGASTKLTAEFQDSMENLKTKLVEAESTIRDKDAKINYLSNEIMTLKDSPKASKAELESSREQIKQLNGIIAGLQKGKAKLPIIDQSLKLQATNLIGIREIKPFMYMNHLISYIGSMFREAQIQDKTDLNFLLVLDPLENEHVVKEYERFGFNINKAPDVNGSNSKAKYPVMVTNLDRDNIMSMVNLSKYKNIILIDRYGKETSAISRPKIKMFYTVDSPQDKITYDLNPSECIYFGEAPKEGKRPAKYYFSPAYIWEKQLKDEAIEAIMSETEFVRGEIECIL